MTPDPRFITLPKSFWAFVRLIGQECGYTERGRGEILVPSREQVESRLERIDIAPGGLARELLSGVSVWDKLAEYFEYRAAILHRHVEPSLMDAEAAKKRVRIAQEETQAAVSPSNEQAKGQDAGSCILYLHDQYVD